MIPKRVRHIFRTKWIAALLAVAASMASCLTDEKLVGGDPLPQNEKLTIHIAVPSNGGAATRALGVADECEVEEISVLAFKKSDKTFFGRYIGFVTSGPTSSGSGGATMTFQVTLPTGEFDLMVMANANAMLGAAGNTLTLGTSQTAVLNALQTTMTTAGWQDDPTASDYRAMPMWGYRKGVTISEGTTSLANPINLARMVAKVDIEMSGALVASNKFELKYVRVYNYSETGRLVPNLAGSFDWDGATSISGYTTPSQPSGGYSKATAPTEFITRSLGTGATSLKNSIYLFEAEAGVSPVTATMPNDYKNNTCLVIGGDYDNSGTTTWYRIDFAQNIGTAQNPNWQYLPLLRNNSYSITINSITGEGHPAPEEALNSVPANIETTILDWNEHDTSVEGSNGIYKLKVSHREYTLSPAAHDAASTDNILTVTTDHSKGWTAKVFADEAGTTASSWLSLSGAGGATATPATGTPMKLIASANTAGNRSAWIHVTAGSIVLKIEVVQQGFSLRIVDAGGNDITALSFAANNGTADQAPAPQTFKVLWQPADLPVTVTKTTATGANTLDWLTDNVVVGTPKTIPGGTGEYAFTIDPAAISSTMLASAPFYSLASSLGFKLTDGSNTATASLAISQGDEFDTIVPGLEAKDVTYPYTGGAQNFQIASYATGTKTSDGSTVTGPVRWKAEFSTDGGTTWTTTPPAWIVGFPTSGTGTPNATLSNISVTAQQQIGITEPNANSDLLKNATERGSSSDRWNLAGNAANGDLSGAPTSETANCYVVNAAGYYKLPLYFGNAFNNPNDVAATAATHSSVIATSQITGATNATLVWQDAPNLITNLGYEAGFLTFDIPKASINQGNAVVAIRNSANKILWSWHIWVTPTSIFDVANPATDAITTRAVAPTTQYTNYFMQYNLGYASATNTTFPARSVQVRITQTGLDEEFEVLTKTITVTQNAGTEATADNTNPYWQWGRKDPFPPGNGILNSYNTERTIYYGADYSRAVSFTYATSVDDAIASPHIFYASGNGANWINSDYLDLWDLGNADRGTNTFGDNDITKTIYDPSPVGFKMPPSNAFTGFTYDGKNGSNVSNLNVFGTFDEGYWFYSYPNTTGGTSGTPVFFPASGYRFGATLGSQIGGTLSLTGFYGNNWSALPGTSATSSYHLGFAANNVVVPFNNNSRNIGNPVRPIKDE
jgi:hypothetical protein